MALIECVENININVKVIYNYLANITVVKFALFNTKMCNGTKFVNMISNILFINLCGLNVYIECLCFVKYFVYFVYICIKMLSHTLQFCLWVSSYRVQFGFMFLYF